jgi:hypothetical protein
VIGNGNKLEVLKYNGRLQSCFLKNILLLKVYPLLYSLEMAAGYYVAVI